MTVLAAHTYRRPDGQLYVFIPALSTIVKSGVAVDSLDMSDNDYAAYREAFITDRIAGAAQSKLQQIHIVPTGACKGGCPYCYAMEAWGDKAYMDPATVEASIALNKAEPQSFHIYGGEPLLDMPAFRRLMAWIESAYPTLLTGMSTGLMIDDADFEDFLQFVAERKDKKTFFASVSIDPFDPAYRYTRRRWGDDTYKILRMRFDRLYRTSKNIGIRFTITRNGSNPFPVLRELLWTHDDVIPSTIELEDSGKMELLPEQLRALLDDQRKWTEEVLVPRGYVGAEQPSDRYLHAPLGHVFTRRGFTESSRACPAGATCLSVNTDGGVAACSHVTTLGLPKRYDEIKQAALDHYVDPRGLPCESCEYLLSCGGGCAASMRKYYTNSRPLSCTWREETIRYAAQMLIEHGHDSVVEAVRMRVPHVTLALEKAFTAR